MLNEDLHTKRIVLIDDVIEYTFPGMTIPDNLWDKMDKRDKDLLYNYAPRH